MSTSKSSKSWPMERLLYALALIAWLGGFLLLVDLLLIPVRRLMSGQWRYLTLNEGLGLLGLKVGGWIGALPISLILIVVLLGTFGTTDGNATSRHGIWKRKWD